MNQTNATRPQIAVSTDDDDALFGRLGFVVLDDENPKFVAFTAAQIAPAEQTLFHEGVEVAYPSAMLIDEDLGKRIRHADSMILPKVISQSVRFSPEQIFSDEGRLLQLGPVVDEPYKYIGQKVLVHTSVDRPRLALFHSPDSYFEMPAYDTGEMTLFKDALELKSLDHQPVATNGDAGALVTFLDGRVLGIVICGINTTCFAAPLWRLLEKFGSYDLLDEDGINGRNDELDRPPSRPVSKEDERALDPSFEAEFVDRIQGEHPGDITKEQALQASKEFF